MSTLSAANIQSQSADTPPVIKDLNGTEVGQFVKAWARLDQDTETVITGFNVASMDEIATGRFSVTFTNAMANANYVAVGLSGNETGNTTGNRSIVRDGTWTTTSASFRVFTQTSEITDDGICLIFCGD